MTFQQHGVHNYCYAYPHHDINFIVSLSGIDVISTFQISTSSFVAARPIPI